MKKGIIFFIGIMLGAGISYAQELAPSKITEVILFSNQAMVNREALVDVKEGLNDIMLEIDAFDVDKESIQAKVLGKGEVFSVQYKEIYLKESAQEKIRELEERIKELEDRKKGLQIKIKISDKKEAFLDSLINFSKTQIPQDIKTNFPSAENLTNLLLFLENNLDMINKGRQDIELKIDDIDKDINVLKKELSALSGRASVNTKKGIEIVFNSAGSQQIRIEASYITHNCSWQPLYKVDVPLDLKEINLIMFSKINQRTGEDWNDVMLSISNVVPLRGVAVPQLESWILDVRRSSASVKERVFSKEKMMEGQAYFKADAVEEEAGFAYAQRKELPLSFEYQLPQPLTIESQDKDTLLPLFAKKLEGKFYYHIVPSASALTFLVSEVTADKELLSGPLNVYFGGRFIGKAYITEKKAGEQFEISLGADREIKVKKTKIEDKIDETILGKIERQTIIRKLAFKVTIENLKDKPARIRILESIPVSKTDKIIVKDVKIIPEPAIQNYQDKEGVMMWEFDLGAKAQKEIDISFVLNYPKDQPIVGIID